jgi:hypothetical protein
MPIGRLLFPSWCPDRPEISRFSANKFPDITFKKYLNQYSE